MILHGKIGCYKCLLILLTASSTPNISMSRGMSGPWGEPKIAKRNGEYRSLPFTPVTSAVSFTSDLIPASVQFVCVVN